MENFGLGGGATLLGVFLLCTCVGIIAGNYLKSQVSTANASSTNITVTNNNQISTIDQGTPTITRTSTVTIKDTTATLGYKLSARISQNTITGSTVTIYSTTSTTCTQSSPCTLNSSTPTEILETTNTTATQAQGHTTDWTVTITLPTNTPQGNYIVDITYSEDPILPPPSLSDITNMQEATQTLCNNTPLGATVNLIDTRDNKYYRVRKMADNRCWMIDNLAYQLLQNNTGATPNAGAPTYNPTVQVDTTPNGTPNLSVTYSVAQYAINTSAYNIPNNGNPTPSYLYNWCAAMGDTSENCATTVAYTAGQLTTPQTGICPAPFRLPIGGAGATTQGNGSNQATAAATTTNEFSKLDIWLSGTGTNRSNANTYPNFTGTGVTELLWLGVLSGLYYSGLNYQGSNGYWWSSTADSGTGAYVLYLSSSNTGVFPAGSGGKNYGFAVRCIL